MKKVIIFVCFVLAQHICFAGPTDIPMCQQTAIAMHNVIKNMPASTAQYYKPSTSEKTKTTCCPLAGIATQTMPQNNTMTEEEYQKALGCNDAQQTTDYKEQAVVKECQQTAYTLHTTLKNLPASAAHYYKPTTSQSTQEKCCPRAEAATKTLPVGETMTVEDYNKALGCGQKPDTSYKDQGDIETCKKTAFSVRDAIKNIPPADAQYYKPSMSQKTKDMCCSLYADVRQTLTADNILSQTSYEYYLGCNEAAASTVKDTYKATMISSSTCANVILNDPYLYSVLQGSDNTYTYTCVDVQQACTDPVLTTSAYLCTCANSIYTPTVYTYTCTSNQTTYTCATPATLSAIKTCSCSNDPILTPTYCILGYTACVDVAAQDAAFAAKLANSTYSTYDPHCTNLAIACIDPILKDGPLPKLCEEYAIPICRKIIPSALSTKKYAPQFYQAVLEGISEAHRHMCCPLYTTINATLPKSSQVDKNTYDDILQCNTLTPLQVPLTTLLASSTCANIEHDDPYLYSLLQNSLNNYNYNCVNMPQACIDPVVTTTTNTCALGGCVDLAIKDPLFAHALSHSKTTTYDIHCANVFNACKDPLFDDPKMPYPHLCRALMQTECANKAKVLQTTEKNTPEYLEAEIVTMNSEYRKRCCQLIPDIKKNTNISEDSLKKYFSCGKPAPTTAEILKQAYILKCRSIISSAEATHNKAAFIYGGLNPSDRKICCSLDYITRNTQYNHDFLCSYTFSELSDFLPTGTCVNIKENDPALYSILQSSTINAHYDYSCINVQKACTDPMIAFTIAASGTPPTLQLPPSCAPGGCVDVTVSDTTFAHILTSNIYTLSHTYDPHCVNLAQACAEQIFYPQNNTPAQAPLPVTCLTYQAFSNCGNLAADIIADPNADMPNKYRTALNNKICCNTPLLLLNDKAFTQLGCKYEDPTPYTKANDYCKILAAKGTVLQIPILDSKRKDITEDARKECCNTADFLYWDDSRNTLKCPPRKYKPGYAPK